jgi:hypothetical protein
VIKYLLLSTVIVLAVAVGVAGWVNRDLIRIKIASVYARVAPKPGGSSAPGKRQSGGLQGDAPWALSALPECLAQSSVSRGSLAYVQARLPKGSVAVVPPATLVYGDCDIRIVGDEAFVRRGTDRLRIPPRVRFYRTSDSLVLIRNDQESAELRVYQPVTTR